MSPEVFYAYVQGYAVDGFEEVKSVVMRMEWERRRDSGEVWREGMR